MIVQTPSSPSTLNSASSAQSQSFAMVLGQNDRMAGSVPVFSSGQGFSENLAQISGKSNAQAVQENSETGKGFGFSDLIDIINPLQHIPVVTQLYQSATGDTMGAVAQIVGGALFGGPIGGAVSAAMVAYQYAKTSSDVVPYANGTPIDVADRREDGFRPFNT